MATINEADILRGLVYLHGAIEAVESLRRTTYVKPEYMADMSTLNAELDRILNTDA